MRCVPAGLESLLGRARLLCHRLAPQQVCRLQLRIDVHHLSELLTALDARVSYPE